MKGLQKKKWRANKRREWIHGIAERMSNISLTQAFNTGFNMGWDCKKKREKGIKATWSGKEKKTITCSTCKTKFEENNELRKVKVLKSMLGGR